MPARRVKTLLRNPNERKHREHRSKKGQKYCPDHRQILDFKRKKLKVYLENL